VWQSISFSSEFSKTGDLGIMKLDSPALHPSLLTIDCEMQVLEMECARRAILVRGLSNPVNPRVQYSIKPACAISHVSSSTSAVSPNKHKIEHSSRISAGTRKDRPH